MKILVLGPILESNLYVVHLRWKAWKKNLKWGLGVSVLNKIQCWLKLGTHDNLGQKMVDPLCNPVQILFCVCEKKKEKEKPKGWKSTKSKKTIIAECILITVDAQLLNGRVTAIEVVKDVQTAVRHVKNRVGLIDKRKEYRASAHIENYPDTTSF